MFRQFHQIPKKTTAQIFIFTDASSKDCDDNLVEVVEDIAISHEDTINFVLTGICGEVSSDIHFDSTNW